MADASMEIMMEPNNFELLDMTTQIVVAAIAANRTDLSIPELIGSAYGALAATTGPAPTAAAPPQEPAVSIRASVKPDAVTCLDCGFSGKMLKRHLLSAHDLTVADYLAKWRLPISHPIVAPNYAIQRRDLAMKIGLGKKPEAAVAPVKRARKAG